MTKFTVSFLPIFHVKHETWFIVFVMKWCDYFHFNKFKEKETFLLTIHSSVTCNIHFPSSSHHFYCVYFDLQIELQLEVKRRYNAPSSTSESGHSSLSSIGKTHNFECWCNAYGGHQTVSSRRASLQFSSKFLPFLMYSSIPPFFILYP